MFKKGWYWPLSPLEDCSDEQLVSATRRNPKWSPDYVRKCVVLYYPSPKAYPYMRNHGLLRLPTKNALLRNVANPNSESGFIIFMAERLREEVKQRKDQARLFKPV